MATANRYYSATAVRTTLVAGVSSSSASIGVDSTAGYPPSVPFTLILDPGQLTEEVVTVTAVGGKTLSVTRGQDGTAASAHDVGAVVLHGLSARDLREPQEHIAATTGVHGVVGHPVGDTDTQTLTNKTLSGLVNTFQNVPKSAVPNDTVYLATAQTLTNKTLSGSANTFTNIPKTAIPADTVYVDATQTLTGKTLTGTANTFSAIPSAAVVGLDTAQTAQNGRLDALELQTQSTTAWTTASGFVNSTTTSRLTKVGRLCQVDLRVDRTGAAITPNANGGISDTLLQTVQAAWRPSGRSVYASGSYVSGSGGTYGCTLRIDTTGEIYVMALAPGIQMATGSTVSGTFTFII